MLSHLKTFFLLVYMSWTSAVCKISCLFNWNVLIKLEPQLTQVGANKWFLPTVVTICLHRFEAEVNTFPHISQMKHFLFYRYTFTLSQHLLYCDLVENIGHFPIKLLVVDLHINIIYLMLLSYTDNLLSVRENLLSVVIVI